MIGDRERSGTGNDRIENDRIDGERLSGGGWNHERHEQHEQRDTQKTDRGQARAGTGNDRIENDGTGGVVGKRRRLEPRKARIARIKRHTKRRRKSLDGDRHRLGTANWSPAGDGELRLDSEDGLVAENLDGR